MWRLLGAALALCVAMAPGARGGEPDPLGMARLGAQLGDALPRGRGVIVAQVEAPSRLRDDAADSARRSFAPDRTHPKLRHVPFAPGTPVTTWGGNHATAVALRFYGADAPAPEVAAVQLNPVRDFLQRLGREPYADDVLAPAKVWNHSWIAGGALPSGAILRQLDRAAVRRDWVVVAGVSNGRPNQPLLASAFNILTVGRSDGGHGQGAAHVDRWYDGERVRPHLVAPAKTASAAAGTVAGAAALLVEAARGGGREGADSALTIRAALMAGANRDFAMASNSPRYRGTPALRSDNGLDTRFGAGQLDVYASHAIVTAPPAGDGAALASSGFEWTDAFAGSGGTARKHYAVRPQHDARWGFALIWPARPGAASLGPDLDLTVRERGAGELAAARSRRERGEHLWVRLQAGKEYEVTVSAISESPRPVPYALAWHAREF